MGLKRAVVIVATSDEAALMLADILRTGEAPSGAGDSGGGGGTLLVVGAIALAGGGAYLVSRSRRRTPTSASVES
mgnify:CR=1 FL=1